MKKELYLTSAAAKKLYRTVHALPIYDYHCHLRAEDIYLNRRFEDVGALMLAEDHYKWRLMRSAGIEEKYITGNATYPEKFRAYAQALSRSPGNPLRDWTAMELSTYFGIDSALTPERAMELYRQANAALAQKPLTPRSVIVRSDVRYIATTDDVCDSLEYHKKLRQELSFPVQVAPSFRTDRLLTIGAADYGAYLQRLSKAGGIAISDFSDFLQAVRLRLDAFCEAGCRFTDVGIAQFPRMIGTEEEVSDIFDKVLAGDEVTQTEQMLFCGYLFVFLGREYRKRNLVMQWHLSVQRDACHTLSDACGADCGSDCVGDPIPNGALLHILNAIDTDGGLPMTILYTLNTAQLPRLISLAGSFRRVTVGAAWWFRDHRREIVDQLYATAENSCLSAFPGMLTDSRSYLSYVRHDYFRRILCDTVGAWVEDGTCTMKEAEQLCTALSCTNTKNMIEKGTTNL